MLLQTFVVVATLTHLQEHSNDVDQHDEIEKSDQIKERGGYRRPNQSPQASKSRLVVCDLRCELLGGEGESHYESQNHRRMAERKEKANSKGLFAFRHQLSSRIVNVRDMIH